MKRKSPRVLSAHETEIVLRRAMARGLAGRPEADGETDTRKEARDADRTIH